MTIAVAVVFVAVAAGALTFLLARESDRPFSNSDPPIGIRDVAPIDQEPAEVTGVDFDVRRPMPIDNGHCGVEEALGSLDGRLWKASDVGPDLPAGGIDGYVRLNEPDEIWYSLADGTVVATFEPTPSGCAPLIWPHLRG